MADLYVRSTDGNNADDGSTWALAEADLHTTAWAAGSRIFVSQAHAPSALGSTMTIASGGTLASPTQILCADDSAEPPTTLATGAEVSTSASSTIALTGHCYVYGLTFKAGSGGSSSSFTAANGAGLQHYKNCSFWVVGTGGSGRVSVSGSAAARPLVLFEGCTFKFAHVGHGIAVSNVVCRINGGSVLSGGTTPTALFLSNDAARAGNIEISGFDMSNCGAGVHLFSANNHRGSIRNSKLPASWTGALTTGTLLAGARYEMYNCDDGDTNYRLWVEDYAGSIKSETTLVMTGGATDGTTPLSWKMAASTNAEYPLIQLRSPELVIWNDTSGSSKTVTVEILHDSATNLQDDEIWLEVQYLGTSGYPLGSTITDAVADVLASPADQATSTATWTTTGMSNPNEQKLSVTFTPQEKGAFLCTVVLALASKTVYVDPQPTVT